MLYNKCFMFRCTTQNTHPAITDQRYMSFPTDMFWIISVTIFFSVCGVPAYIPHRYHFVNENKTWSEAQTYCRDKYTDLATISNMDEMKKLNITLKIESEKLAWIGLKSESVGEWKWSLADQTFYRGGDTYRNWSSGEPNNNGGNEHCVDIAKTGFWFDIRCDLMLPFVCYEGKNSRDNYTFIHETKTWYEAQTFCREKYTDLVSVRNQTENELITNLIQTAVKDYGVWIGLYNDSWKWSDQSNSSFRYWSSDKPRDDLKCAAVSGSEQHYWSDLSCTEQLPFICHEKFLILIKENLSWWEALNYCRNHHHDLVSVRSEEMQLWLKEVIQNASSEHVWLGLRHDCAQRIWFWVYGSMICYQNWAPGYGTWNEDCSQEKRSGAVQAGGTQQWIDLPESYKLNFICSTYDD
ncbi:C-type mannose receptor 2-like isoform X2 [Silurus meridionalis]|uniref:C-type mannose receptor 2-like isoform X2 n=1 Tax=Silurus meridionalis TaxID=175797 RepID=UPI001EEC6D0D|nr:C-type mannose receptor 2-like isoform X2 [Silurus meridionalis]